MARDGRHGIREGESSGRRDPVRSHFGVHAPRDLSSEASEVPVTCSE